MSTHNDDGCLVGYGLKALVEESNKVACAPRGTRNIELYKASASIGELVAGGEIPEEHAINSLMFMSEMNDYIKDHSPKQALDTIRGGLKQGRKNPRTRPEPLPLKVKDQKALNTVRLEKVFNGDEIPDLAMKQVREAFAKYGHAPSEKHMDGLHQISKAIEAMALRIHENPEVDEKFPEFARSFFVSFLPCGMGKTSTLIETVKAILSLEDYNHVGVIIFLWKLDEIRKLVELMGLKKEEFAILTSDVELNMHGSSEKSRARVLFTTQQMLEKYSGSGDKFQDMKDYYFKGKPRQVRVWDEAILPAKPLTLSRDDIAALPKALRPSSPELADAVHELSIGLAKVEDGSLIEMPSLEKYNITVEQALAQAGGEDEQIKALFSLQSRVVRVSRDRYGMTTLQYEDILPDDLAPMLILDASGQQRKTYEYWYNDRKGIKFLSSPQKSYAGFTVHHWDIGAGRKAQSNNKENKQAQKIAEGVARTIKRDIPRDKKVLVICFKPNARLADMERLISEQTGGDILRVRFITWGQHTATNDFSDFEYVILAGVLQYNTADYIAMGLGAKGKGIENGLIENEVMDVRIGEISHHILQAACRGKVRRSVGDGCPPGCHLYMIYSSQPPHGIPGEPLAQRIFPGCTYEAWTPVVDLGGKKQQALVDVLRDRMGTLGKRWLMDKIGERDLANLNKVLKDSKVIDYLKIECGRLIEVGEKEVIVTKDPSFLPF